jgi:hypothetical protein
MVRIEYQGFEYPSQIGMGPFYAADFHGKSILSKLSCYLNITTRYSLMPDMWIDIKPYDNHGNIVMDHSSFLCAFHTINEMFDYVERSEIPELAEAGFRIFYIEAHTFLVGSYQCAFRNTDVLSKVDITDYFLK